MAAPTAHCFPHVTAAATASAHCPACWTLTREGLPETLGDWLLPRGRSGTRG